MHPFLNFRYPKINANLTCCTIGMKPAVHYEENSHRPTEESFPFLGQMGPTYLFGDVLSVDQVKGIYSLGPNYMYSFVANEFPLSSSGNGAFDAKDDLSSKIIFGLNAQVILLIRSASLAYHIIHFNHLNYSFISHRPAMVGPCLMLHQVLITFLIETYLKQLLWMEPKYARGVCCKRLYIVLVEFPYSFLSWLS